MLCSVVAFSCTGKMSPGETVVVLNQGIVQAPPPPSSPPPIVPPPPQIVPPPPQPTVAVAMNTCTVQVGRTPETEHPNAAMQARVKELNDKFRALLNSDVWVGEDGGRAVLDCDIAPGNVAQQTSQGLVLPIYQTKGMPPVNYFLTQQRPGVEKVVGHDGQALQLLPFQLSTPGNQVAADFDAVASLLPKPSFSVTPLRDALPDVSIAVTAGGTYQINNVLRFDITPNGAVASSGKAANGGAVPAPANGALHLKMTVVVGPDGCAWNCENRVPNIQDRSTFKGNSLAPGEVLDALYNEVKRIVDEKHAAGKPVQAAAVMQEALTSIRYDTSDWLELQYHFITGADSPATDAALSAQLSAMDPSAALNAVPKEFSVPLLVFAASYDVRGGGAGIGGCSLVPHQ